ncbi:MAG: hypothetical protein AAFO80_08245 [Pseudomonadota bacterium]
MPTYRKNPKTGKFAASNKRQGPAHLSAPQARPGRYDHLHPAEREDARAASLYADENRVSKDKDLQAEQKIERRQAQREIEEARLALDPEAEKAAALYPNTPSRRVAPPTSRNDDPRTPEVKAT